MSKQNEGLQETQKPAQLVYVVTRYGNIYAVYECIEDAQDAQRVLIAKGNICDVQAHLVKSKTF